MSNQTPFAALYFTVDAGILRQGGLTVAGGNVVQLSCTQMAGLSVALWEIATYPDGFSVSSGWSLNSSTGAIQCTTANGTPPPAFTIPFASALWGKFLFRLTVNGGLVNGLEAPATVDANSGVQTLSPSYALVDVAFDEAGQFNPVKQGTGELQKSLRIIDRITGGGGGGGGTGLPAAPSAAGYYLLAVSSGGAPSWVPATANEIGAGFSVSLALASGGSGPFELGDTWTPTFNATPATNSGSVTSCSISDNVGNSVSSSSANPLNAPSGGHTYSLTSAGTVSVLVQESQISPPVTANSNGVSASWIARAFYGVDGANTATSATASSNNATLSDSVSVTGTLLSIGVGSVFPTMTPSNQYIAILTPHTSSAHTFNDALSGFAFPVAAPHNFAFTNQHGVSVSMDLYFSSSLLNGSFAPRVAL